MNMYLYICDAVNEKQVLLEWHPQPGEDKPLVPLLKDNDGQTPLCYAIVYEREVMAEYLVKHNEDTDLKDNDGSSSCDICEI
ncbi:hypothetical protein AHAS_Ahas17G0178700 [Arachis hypogaea]